MYACSVRERLGRTPGIYSVDSRLQILGRMAESGFARSSLNHNNHNNASHAPPVSNGVSSRVLQHPSQSARGGSNYPMSQTLQASSSSGRTSRHHQAARHRSELDIAHETLARIYGLFKDNDNSHESLKKRIVAIAEASGVYGVFARHRDLGPEHRDTYYASYVLGISLMVIYDNELELEEQTWNGVKKDYYEMVDFITEHRDEDRPFRNIDLTPAHDDDGDWENEPAVEPNDVHSDGRDSVEKASAKWLRKTIDVFHKACAGYTRLFREGKLNFGEKLRLSNIHNRLSELAIVAADPSEALEQAELALKVLEDMKVAPPRVVSAASMQVGVCRRFLSDRLLTTAVEDIKKSVDILVKLKVDTEKEWMMLDVSTATASFGPAQGEKLLTQQRLADYESAILQQVDTLVNALDRAGVRTTDEANDAAREFMESRITKYEEDSGITTNWDFLDIRMLIPQDKGLGSVMKIDAVNREESTEEPVAIIAVKKAGVWSWPENEYEETMRKYSTIQVCSADL